MKKRRTKALWVLKSMRFGCSNNRKSHDLKYFVCVCVCFMTSSGKMCSEKQKFVFEHLYCLHLMYFPDASQSEFELNNLFSVILFFCSSLVTFRRRAVVIFVFRSDNVDFFLKFSRNGSKWKYMEALMIYNGILGGKWGKTWIIGKGGSHMKLNCTEIFFVAAFRCSHMYVWWKVLSSNKWKSNQLCCTIFNFFFFTQLLYALLISPTIYFEASLISRSDNIIYKTIHRIRHPISFIFMLIHVGNFIFQFLFVCVFQLTEKDRLVHNHV